MKNLKSRFRDVFLIILIGGFFPLAAQQHQHRHQHRYRGGEGGGGQLNIVCSFSDYASIAEYIAGPDATVQFIAHGEQDPHFVAPKPSYAMMLNKADMWIWTWRYGQQLCSIRQGISKSWMARLVLFPYPMA